jgi:23S rRNA (adenine-N6)-dimethyltransferase
VSAAGRRWGWHRLGADWARRIVAAADVQPGDLVLDLGAGTGALTRPLVRAGARVIAVELHPGRAAALRERFADAPVRVVQADLERVRLPHQPFRVVANPPYSVSTAILRRLLAPRSRLETADVLLPAWLVARYVAGRGADAHRWGHRYVADRGLRLPRHAFSPPPPSDWAVLNLHLSSLDRRRPSG